MTELERLEKEYKESLINLANASIATRDAKRACTVAFDTEEDVRYAVNVAHEALIRAKEEQGHD